MQLSAKVPDLQKRAQSIRRSDRSLSPRRILASHCQRAKLHGDSVGADRERARHFPRHALRVQLKPPVGIRAIAPKSARTPLCVTWRKSSENAVVSGFLERTATRDQKADEKLIRQSNEAA
jgi:hypothetical protein